MGENKGCRWDVDGGKGCTRGCIYMETRDVDDGKGTSEMRTREQDKEKVRER